MMSRRRWLLVLFVVVADLLAIAFTVHARVTWHRVANGPATMPLSELVGWVFSVGLLAVVGFIFFDAWDTARNGPHRRDGD